MYSVSRLLAAGLLIPAQFLMAQSAEDFSELRMRHLPADRGSGSAVALGDLDGDGDVDAVLGHYGSADLVCINDGRGRFAVRPVPGPAGTTRGVALADVDGDGDLDVAIVRFIDGGPVPFGAQNALLLNDGFGNLTDVTATHLPAVRDLSTGLRFADVDGDSDLDLWIAGTLAVKLLVNDGSGRFADVTASQVPGAVRAEAVEVLDADGDGDLDVLLGAGDVDELRINDGSGRFSLTRGAIPAVLRFTRAFAVGDLDRDGDVDVAIGHALGIDVLINDGAGYFVDETFRWGRFEGSCTALQLRDLSGTGRLDLVANYLDRGIRYYHHDVSRGLVDATEPRGWIHGEATAGAFAIDELDGDASADLLIATDDDAAHRLMLGVDRLGPVDASAAAGIDDAFEDRIGAVAVADVTGDGRVDVVASVDDQLVLARNEGDGLLRFVESARFPLLDHETAQLLPDDLDGDGDIDLLRVEQHGIASYSAQILVNIGQGAFRDDTPLLLGFGVLGRPSLGDVDLDGDSDLIASQVQHTELYVNDGQGRFTLAPGRFPGLFGQLEAASFGDIDGDGDVDVVGRIGAVALLLQDAQGRFAAAPRGALPPLNGTPVALEDIDADGDLDILVVSGVLSVLVNDGNVHFTDVSATALPNSARPRSSVSVADFDEDGDVDLYVGGGAGQADELLRNRGDGVFIADPDGPAAGDRSTVLAGADFDGDDDVDVLLARARQTYQPGGGLLLARNLRRQIDVPFVPAVGGTLDVEFHMRDAGSPTSGIALPWVALSRASHPLRIEPFGAFGLAPDSAVPLGPVGVVGGFGRVSYSLPSISVSLGFTLNLQAVMLPSQDPMTWRLSNVVGRQVAR
jgi:hypothetical protein